MTSVERLLKVVAPAELPGEPPVTRWTRFEALLERASERLNPILVKEARQALRSRQFTFTFFLMLLGGWGWSVIGLARIGPGAQYSAEGPDMFYVYHLILAFPLLVVAPYAAFHSLSMERQDRTYELVCITSLGARQILTGKLGSLALQMIVYLSAIFPCLAFTYLLRGLDIFSVIFAVIYTACTSLGLAVLGLLLATANPVRQRQVVMSVLYTLVLFGVFILNSMWTNEIVTAGLPVDSAEFWGVNTALATIYVNYFALAFLAARSHLLGVCQNRSTALRVALVVAHSSIIAWMAWSALTWSRVGVEVFRAFVFMLTLLWYVAGVFLSGESDMLPPRVKRDLPQSMLGRAFFTWFMPGSGTGYMFVIANMLAGSIMACLPYAWIRSFMGGAPGPGSSWTLTISANPPWKMCLVAICYLVIYLGIGRLLLRLIARAVEVRVAMRVVVHACLMLFGCGIPWVVQMTTPVWRDMDYTLLQTSNAVWTLTELVSKGLPFQMPVLLVILPAAALAVWVANLPSLLAELRQEPGGLPERMLEEDAQLAAASAAARRPRSPWDSPNE